MKFALATLLSTLLVGFASAQRVSIGHPADRTQVAAGSNVIVEIDKPNSLSASTEVAVVIAINSCHNTACISPADILGTILYNGPYQPQLVNASPFKPPHQNFTVTIPSTFAKGPAQLGVYHVALIGAGPEPFSETLNTTLIIH